MLDKSGYSSLYPQKIMEFLKNKHSFFSYKTNKQETKPCSLKGSRPHRDSKLRLQLDAVYSSKYDNWLRSFGLKPCWEVHKDCLEKHIWHGYRPNPSSISYCLRSAFYPSNETLNMWTHAIPFVLMIWRIHSVVLSLDQKTEELTYPFWIHSFGCLFSLLLSAAAHLFNCYSATGQEFAFCFDYGAIDVYGMASTISFQYMLCPTFCFGLQADWFPVSYTNTVLLCGIIASVVTFHSRYPSCPLRYVCRFAPYCICYVIAGFPCFIRYMNAELPQIFNYTTLNHHRCYLDNDFTSNYIFHLTWYFLGIMAIASRFPECIYPGTFDIVGHSHQWFHIFTAIGMYVHNIMVENTMKEAIKFRNLGLFEESFLNISFSTTFVPAIIFVVVIQCIACYMARKIGLSIEKERQKIND